MTLQLMPHQRVGADWLKSRNRAYLGDRPRVGKTLTLATAAKEIGAKSVLVICPAIVRTHWRETFGETNYTGRLHIHSYDAIVRGGLPLREQILRDTPDKPDVLILDEAHMLKSFDAQRTKLILGKIGYARHIGIVWAASGTPVPRHPGEWYTVGSTLFPQALMDMGIFNYADFEENFLTKFSRYARGQWIDKESGIQNDSQFRELLAKTMIQRTLDDIGPEQPKLLWQVLALDSAKIVAVVGAPTASTGQSYEHAPALRHQVGDVKAPLVLKLLLDHCAESDEKIVVFAHHLSVLAHLQEGLAAAEIGHTWVDGATYPTQRNERLAQFRDDPNCQVFLGQNIACMMGIDLSAASTILSVEPDWVATNNDQLGHRILGPKQQSKHVVAQMISLAGTIDDSIVRQNAREAAWQHRMFPEGV